MKRRVVVTGMGIVSCIGNELAQVAESLKSGRSGIRAAPEFIAAGLSSQVAGVPSLESLPQVKRSMRRFMSDSALYAFHAGTAAIADAALDAARVTDPRTALIVGSGYTTPLEIADSVAVAKTRGPRKVEPYVVPRMMGNTTSANLATAFGIQGPSYSIVSACSTSSHCIGHGAELIELGKVDRAIVGGAEEVRWTMAAFFDAMRALSSGFNDRPQQASRPYDVRRDGFVMAGGAAVMVIEELDSALARGARVHAELAGYGASSDGSDMVTPRADGIGRAMPLAREQAGSTVDYINTHGTSTPVGDLIELEAIRAVFDGRPPQISSTKGLTGHSIGAAGAHEAIYSVLMLQQGFVAGCANLEEVDPKAGDLPIVTATRAASLDNVMSNSLGFGGTNASLVFRRWRGKSA